MNFSPKNLLLCLGLSIFAVILIEVLISFETQIGEAAVYLGGLVVIFLGMLLAQALGSQGGQSGQGNATSSASNKQNNRSNTKTQNSEEGSVKWFNVKKGYGFITRDSGEDIFVHYKNILGDGKRVLQEGQKVRFIVITGDKGPQADQVKPLR